MWCIYRWYYNTIKFYYNMLHYISIYMSKCQTFDSCCQAIPPKNNCKKRKFRDNSSKLLNLLINIKKEILPKITSAILTNNEESKYKNFNYNGLFHKGLAHNLVDGRLMSTNDYDKMKLAIYNGHQQNLLSIPNSLCSCRYAPPLTRPILVELFNKFTGTGHVSGGA